MDVAKLLIEHGSDINAPEGTDSPLSRAAAKGRANMMQLLLEHDAKVNARDERDYTPLHYAAFYGHLDCIKLLLEHGADPNAKSEGGDTPADLAAYGGHSEVVKLLIALDEFEKSGSTMLHATISHSHVGLAELLISEGFDVNAKNADGDTPLHRAAFGGVNTGGKALQMIRLLVERGADLRAKDNAGYTPLHVSARHSYLQRVELLLELGADANIVSAAGRTPLHTAATTWHSERLIRELIRHGAKVNARDENGITPLHIACEKTQPPGVQALLDHGADVDALANRGGSPLHAAARAGFHYADHGKLLIDAGAYVNARDENKKTPLELARELDRDELVQLLQGIHAP